MRNALFVTGVGVIILAIGWWFLAHRNTIEAHNLTPAVPAHEENSSATSNTPKETQGAAIGEENLVTFKCDGGKSITAVFERDIVGLTLSDGRQITLRQATSGSGIRYLSNDSKIEFRGKGNEGNLTESAKTTYSNCKASN